MSNFEFNAPQFVNFSDVDDINADRFFDTNEPNQMKNTLDSTTKVIEAPACGQTEVENQVPSSTTKSKIPTSAKKNFSVLRKVLHEIVNQQIQSDTNVSNKEFNDQTKDVIQQFDKLQVSESKSKKSRGPLRATEVFSGLNNRGSEKKSHPMMTRLDSLNQRSASKQSLSSQQSEDASECNVSSTTVNYGKSASVKRNASPLQSARKFISLAEQVEHFYKDTPERFRSKPTAPRRSWTSKPSCIPKTPNLTTKFRQRKVNFPNEKEREEMELEEMKKHQIKAHPLNEKILMGPNLHLKAPVTKKPVTVPQPFSLTEVKKKEAPSEPVFQFKAQPIPSTILNGPIGVPPKKVAPATVPTTPQIKVPLRLRVEVKQEDKNTSSDCLTQPRNTVIEPFSFDGRMKDLLQKKEQFVRKVIEEEKKSFSSFKAHPMPDFKKRSDLTPKIDKIPRKTIPQPFNLTQPKSNKTVEDQNTVKFRSSTQRFWSQVNSYRVTKGSAMLQRVTPFKARPASVVHQTPFAPKLQKHETHFPQDFHLFTEQRAAERQKFDEKIKQKEEERATILRLQKETEERLEKEKILEERKKLEFKAAPMPRYKVFEIHASDPNKITIPQSPTFVSKSRKANAK